MWSTPSSSSSKSAIAGRASLPASASKMLLSGVGVYCWKPWGHSSSSAAVWSFFWKTKSTLSWRPFSAWVSGSESGPGPR
jgi:hypothetical protein